MRWHVAHNTVGRGHLYQRGEVGVKPVLCTTDPEKATSLLIPALHRVVSPFYAPGIEYVWTERERRNEDDSFSKTFASATRSAPGRQAPWESATHVFYTTLVTPGTETGYFPSLFGSVGGAASMAYFAGTA